jgi:hypothetical protein
MKHLVFSALILLFTPLLSSAQVNLKRGFVVTSQGDTLKGYLDYKEWIKTPKSVSFNATPANKDKQDFTPLNCRYFEIEGLEAYQTYHGRVSADKTDFNNIPKAIDTSKVFVQAFLKVLQKGEKVTLLMLSDDIKVRFFLKDNKENNIQELGFRRYVDPIDKNKIKASKNYMGQLLFMANKYNEGSPQLKRQIELADYISTDLIKIVSVINNFDKTKPTFKSESKKYRFFAGAGLNQSTTRIVGTHLLAHQDTEIKTSVLPKVIIGADLFLNPNVRRIILRGELSFTKTNQQLYRQEDNTSANQTTAHQEFKQNIISLFPQALYNLYNGENLKFFLGSGLYASRVFYAYNKYEHQETFVNGATYRIGSDDYYKLDKFWYLVPVKGGFTFNDLELSAIYFPPITISKYHNFAFVTKSVHIQLNYLFNK